MPTWALNRQSEQAWSSSGYSFYPGSGRHLPEYRATVPVPGPLAEIGFVTLARRAEIY
jgi:hypothetical protein